jgi:hypothetical protein
MSEDAEIIIITLVGCIAMITIAYFFIKIMINTYKDSKIKK